MEAVRQAQRAGMIEDFTPNPCGHAGGQQTAKPQPIGGQREVFKNALERIFRASSL
jgi:hypothetical protein